MPHNPRPNDDDSDRSEPADDRDDPPRHPAGQPHRDGGRDERDRRDPPKRPGRSAWMDEEDARPRKRGVPLWAVLLIVFTGIAAVGCVGSLFLAALG